MARFARKTLPTLRANEAESESGKDGKMISETQRELLGHLAKTTLDAFPHHMERLTTAHIANTLHISRNLASQYLNELVRAGLALKVGTRPVFYLHRGTVEKLHGTQLPQSSFENSEALLAALNGKGRRDLLSAIGANLSLSPCVTQCKAAIQYPHNGLPLLLMGERGTGKRHLARLSFEYGRNEGIIPQGGAFVEVDCSQDEPAIKDLRADGSWRQLLLGAARGGVIYFSHAEHLSDQGLATLCESHPATSLGDDLTTTTRIFLSTEMPAHDERVQAISRRVPLVASIPSYHQRTYQEREELISLFLKRQAQRLESRLLISRGAFSCLTEATFPENIDGLRACITTSCAQAYLRRKKDSLVIHAYQLPPTVIRPVAESQPDDDDLIDIEAQPVGKDDECLVQLLDALLEVAESLPERGQVEGESPVVRDLEMRNRDIQDHIMFERRMRSQQVETYERIINEILDDVRDRFSLDLSVKSGHLLAQEIIIQMRGGSALSEWTSSHEGKLDALHGYITAQASVAAAVEQHITRELRRVLGFDLSILTRTLLLLDVSASSSGLVEQSTVGIILSHGYSTATSMADAANRILRAHVFEGINMFYDQQMADVATPLRQMIERYSYCPGVILLVDMGSLEQIDNELEDIGGRDIGIINNASTGLALEVGSGILDNRSIEDILAQAVTACAGRYRIVSRKQKEAAVIFCSEISIDAADKIRLLIERSLPHKIPLNFVVRSYQQLEKNGRHDTVFEHYDVLGAIGTMNPGLRPSAFIALEDVISAVGVDRLDAIFSPYLSEKDLETFHRRLVKNMTLRSVIESITILNPERLFADVESAVSQLEHSLSARFDSRLLIGLNIHLCCLVDRLVTKTPVESYGDEEDFQRVHADFLSAFRKSFSAIAQRYKVEVPIGEVAYVYDYIKATLESARTNRTPRGGEAMDNE